ncbi:Rieske (2Fe-2S) protein [Streptomyces sp. NPDC058157]|uniref:Rieske (2Fe-2S) protein n=1 Tax=Streptomyces sp. NPDC058157 TaxID=3346360 RepID=UPI0036EEDCB3
MDTHRTTPGPGPLLSAVGRPAQAPEADALLGVGPAAAAPAATADWADRAELPPEQVRTGLVHALADTAGVARQVRDGWRRLGPLTAFPVGRAALARVDGVDVLVVREEGGTVRARAERCSRRGVRCPWHRSPFRPADGRTLEGRATAPARHRPRTAG